MHVRCHRYNIYIIQRRNINTSYTDVKSVTGGKVVASGTTKNQDISISTGGVYESENLVSEKTEVRINAGGEAYVHATKSIDIKIKAGGDVFVYGDPELVEKNRILGGRIKMMQ